MSETTDKELEELMLSCDDGSWSTSPEIRTDRSDPEIKIETTENRSATDYLGRRLSWKPDECNPVWNNEMVFMLIDQYKLFKPILDDKQHAKKPVWEKIAENLINMGCNVTAVQCSQKWRNMMLQRRQKKQRQVLGLVSLKAITQPWEEALEEVAPAIDPDQLANMPVPNGSIASDSPRMTQYLKRKRTEDAIMKSLNTGSPTMVNNENIPAGISVTVSPSGSSDPDEPSTKLPRVISPRNDRSDEKFERVFTILAQIQAQQARAQQDQEERAQRQAERDERRLQLLAQFLALFGQATRMFLAFEHTL